MTPLGPMPLVPRGCESAGTARQYRPCPPGQRAAPHQICLIMPYHGALPSSSCQFWRTPCMHPLPRSRTSPAPLRPSLFASAAATETDLLALLWTLESWGNVWRGPCTAALQSYLRNLTEFDRQVRVGWGALGPVGRRCTAGGVLALRCAAGSSVDLRARPGCSPHRAAAAVAHQNPGLCRPCPCPAACDGHVTGLAQPVQEHAPGHEREPGGCGWVGQVDGSGWLGGGTGCSQQAARP